MFTDSEIECMNAFLKGHASSVEFYLESYCAYTTPADIFRSDEYALSVFMLVFVACYNVRDVFSAFKAAYPKRCTVSVDAIADTETLQSIFVERVLTRTNYADILVFIKAQTALIASMRIDAPDKLQLFNVEEAIQCLMGKLPDYYPGIVPKAVETPRLQSTAAAAASVDSIEAVAPNWFPAYLLERNNTHRARPSVRPVVRKPSGLSITKR